MTKFAQNATLMNSAINNVDKVRKWVPKKLEIHVHFEKPCSKLKNVNFEITKIKILKNLTQIFMPEFLF